MPVQWAFVADIMTLFRTVTEKEIIDKSTKADPGIFDRAVGVGLPTLIQKHC